MIKTNVTTCQKKHLDRKVGQIGVLPAVDPLDLGAHHLACLPGEGLQVVHQEELLLRGGLCLPHGLCQEVLVDLECLLGEWLHPQGKGMLPNLADGPSTQRRMERGITITQRLKNQCGRSLRS